MPLRVADADVKAILETTVDTDPFILAASLLIDRYLVPAGLPHALLTEIERWLAAHLVCIRDPRLHEARAGEVSMRLERGRAGVGLQATSYGSQVKLLDPTGLLDEAMTTKRAYIKVD